MKKVLALLVLTFSFFLTGCNGQVDGVLDIIGADEVTIFVGTDLPDFLDGVSIDGLEDLEGYTLVVDYTSVNKNVVGTYDVVYSVMLAGEKVYQETVAFTVTDQPLTSMPLIQGAKDITYVLGSKYPNLYEGVTAIDREFGDLSRRLRISANGLDYENIGVYNVTYYAENEEGYGSSVTIQVHVVGGEDFAPLPSEFLLVQQYDKWGIVDTNDNVIVPLDYDQIDYLGASIIKMSLGDDRFYYNFTTEKFFNSEYDLIGTFSEGLITAMNDTEKMGFVNTSGKEVIPFIYSYASNFKDGEAMVNIYGNVGTIDVNGEMIFDIIYDSISFYDEYYVLHLNGEYIYLTRDMEELFNEGTIYSILIDNVDEYDYRYFNDNGNLGIVDEEYNVIIPALYNTFEYTSEYIIAHHHDGTEDLYTITGEIVYMMADDYLMKENYIYVLEEMYDGLIEKATNDVLILPNTYSYIDQISEDTFIVSADGDLGIIDKNNVVLLPLEYRRRLTVLEDTLYSFERQSDSQKVLVDVNGSILTEDRTYNYMYPFIDGSAIVMNSSGFYGMISETGEEVLPLIYGYIDEFTDGFARTRISQLHNSGTWGVINQSFETVVPNNYYYISYLNDGLFAYQATTTANTHGYMNTAGETVLAHIYADTFSFYNGVGIVELPSGLYKRVDVNGDFITDNEYYEVQSFSNGQSIVSTTADGNSKCLIDPDGAVLGTCDNTSITSWGNSHYLVINSNGEENLMRLDGSLVLDVYIEEIVSVSDEYIQVLDSGKYHLYSSTGVLLTSENYYMMAGDNETYAIYNDKTEKYSFYNYDNELLFDQSYSDFYAFDKGFAFVRGDSYNNWGVIDLEGNVVVALNNNLSNVNESIYKIYLDGLYSYIEITDNGLVKTLYSNEETGELIYAEIDSTWTIYNQDEDVLAMIDATNITYTTDKYLDIELNGKHGVADLEGNMLIDPLFDNIMFDVDGDYHVVVNDDNYGLVDSKRNVIADAIYEDIYWNLNYGVVYANIGDVYSVFDLDGNRLASLEYQNILFCTKDGWVNNPL